MKRRLVSVRAAALLPSIFSLLFLVVSLLSTNFVSYWRRGFLNKEGKVNRTSSTISEISVFSISGFYFYIEASGKTWGQVARFESPKIQGNGNTTCMVFYYHLYGQTVETLRVKVGDQVLWEISGSQGNNWYKATVPLNYVGIYRVSNCRESYTT